MLRLLGTPHVALDRNSLTDLPEKAFILFAVLALQFGGVASREQIRDLLWEESTATRAAASLRWLLAAIRRWESTYGLRLIAADRTTLALAPNIEIDVEHIVRTEEVETRADLERLLAAYRGELLSGVGSGVGPQLLGLIVLHRTRLRSRFVALARRAAERIGGERGERILRQLIDEAPDDEAVVQSLLLHVSKELGERAVEDEYRQWAAKLRADFDAEPTVATLALVAQLAPAVASAEANERQPPDAAPAGIPKIVLLPPSASFAVEPHIAAIADAMVEDVSLQLCRMRTFAMFAPHTARQVAGLDPVAAMAPFDVGYVAWTRLLPAIGGGLRLSLCVIRKATQAVVFAEQFDFNEARLEHQFAQLAEAIAGHVANAVEQVEIGTYRKTGSASAYVQYLLGTKAFDDHDLKALRAARHHFARALELEPHYVPAMTGIARTLSKELLALRRSDSDLATKAMELADRAANIDPLDPNAWREKAMASLYLHDIDASLAYLDAAQTRARHHADIIAEKADTLVHASHPTEAKQHILDAMSLNPLPPDHYHWTLGAAEFFLGRYQESIAALTKMKNTDTVSRLVAAAAAMTGDLKLAARYRQRWLTIYPDSRIADLAHFLPHANKADVNHFVGALKRAGFP